MPPFSTELATGHEARSAAGRVLSPCTAPASYTHIAIVRRGALHSMRLRARATRAGAQCVADTAGEGHILRCAREHRRGVNRLLCAHTAGARRPGTMWGRTNQLVTLGWPHAGAGAGRASDLTPILPILTTREIDSRRRFQPLQNFRISVGKKTCKMVHYSPPDNAPGNGIWGFRTLP